MNKDLTEIVFVLDRSGSMLEGDKASGAVEGFNTLVSEQAKEPGATLFSLVLFDHEYVVRYQRQPIAQVPLLDRNSYRPRGNTALYDAIGKSVDDLGALLAHEAEEDRPGKVIIAILTDGEENFSRGYSRERIAEMIQHQQEVYGWEFIFLSSELKAVEDMRMLNVLPQNTIHFRADRYGTQVAVEESSALISGMRNEA